MDNDVFNYGKLQQELRVKSSANSARKQNVLILC